MRYKLVLMIVSSLLVSQAAYGVSDAHLDDIASAIRSYFSIGSHERDISRHQPLVSSYKNGLQGLPPHYLSASDILNQGFNTLFLKAGDRIIFKDRSQMTLANYLGAGNNTQVFAIKEDPHAVVRIPSLILYWQWHEVADVYHRYPKTQHEALNHGYPMLKTWTHEELIFTQRIEPFLSLEQFLLSPSSDTAKLNAVIEFVKTLRELPGTLTDTDLYQVAWHQDRWVFVDFGSFVKTARRLSNGFTVGNNILLNKIYAASQHSPVLAEALKEYVLTRNPYDEICASTW